LWWRSLANPVGFEGAKGVADAAPGEEAYVRPLPMYMDEQQIISCWRLSEEELQNINATGVVWLSVTNVGILPPVFVSGIPLLMVGDRFSEAEPYFEPPKRA